MMSRLWQIQPALKIRLTATLDSKVQVRQLRMSSVHNHLAPPSRFRFTREASHSHLSRFRRSSSPQKESLSLSAGFFWLSAFYFVYCARPQEVVSGLGWIPVVKLTGAFALLSLLLHLGRAARSPSDLPREAYYLLGLIGTLFVSAVLSPVWRGGAFSATLEFSKVCVLWILAFLLITSVERLRRILFIQAASVALVSIVALVKGYSVDRLYAVVGGIYSNPNDLAFAIVLSLPLALALMFTAERFWVKVAWCLGMLTMGVALIRTASRAGFIDLLIAGAVCLWQFGIKGRRYYLIPATALIGVVLITVAGGALRDRLGAVAAEDAAGREEAAQSYEERKILMGKALEGIAHYPILGVGAENFVVYSGLWLQVHAAYLQIAVEGGIPSLILYLLFFYRGFLNLKRVREANVSGDAEVFRGALLASLIGFVVGAAFSPEAYHFFPYFTVCCSSVLAAVVAKSCPQASGSTARTWRRFDSSRVVAAPGLESTT
jgi:O-antigen ligase